MSAIWGRIVWKKEIPEDTKEKMLSPYQRKCRLDSMQFADGANYHIACGIQHITKESERETLPIKGEKHSYVLTADAILDNRNELCKELKLPQNAANQTTDGELIKEVYERWGIEGVTKLRGLFAIAVYDFEKEKIYLAVDPVSARCLYYYYDKEAQEVMFSTLIDAIRGIYPEMPYNEMYLDDFMMIPGLMPNLIAGETPMRDIFQVLPGRYMEISEEGIQVTKYATINKLEDCHCKKAKDYGAYFRSLYEQCVKDALRCNGEVAVSMSSGLDSASVGTLAAKELEKAKRNIYTYTYVPYRKPEKARVKNNILDETEDVNKITALHPNMVQEFCNNEGKNCLERIEEVIDVIEMPIKAYVNFPNLFEIYEKAAQRGCKIVLTGQSGNDTVSFGYIDDILFDLFEKHKYVTLLSRLNRYSKKVGDSRKKAIKGCWNYFKHAHQVLKNPINLTNYASYNCFASEALRKRYPLEKRMKKAGFTYLEAIPNCEETYHRSFERDAMFCYLGAMETKVGLHFGVLLRDVTKDERLRRFFANVPYTYMGYKGTPRWFIRENLRDILPTDLLDDWMRYGVQNVDCYDRVKRDWKEISEKLEQEIAQKTNDTRINRPELEAYLSRWTSETDTYLFDQAMFAYALLIYQ